MPFKHKLEVPNVCYWQKNMRVFDGRSSEQNTSLTMEACQLYPFFPCATRDAGYVDDDSVLFSGMLGQTERVDLLLNGWKRNGSIQGEKTCAGSEFESPAMSKVEIKVKLITITMVIICCLLLLDLRECA